MTQHTEHNRTYYGTAETEEIARTIITFKVITDDWRVLVGPTPLMEYHKVQSGTLMKHIGYWFILHRFHVPTETGAQE